jgi:nitric oxide reductase NorE protein
LTVALVTSGWLAAEAVHACRQARFAVARRFYAGAIASGVGFVGLKVHDWVALVRQGHHLGSNDFWDAWFLGTGFHLVHVLVGLLLLGLVATRVGRTRFEDDETAIAGTALFWHLCDLAWFFLFPLFFVRGTP